MGLTKAPPITMRSTLKEIASKPIQKSSFSLTPKTEKINKNPKFGGCRFQQRQEFLTSRLLKQRIGRFSLRSGSRIQNFQIFCVPFLG